MSTKIALRAEIILNELQEYTDAIERMKYFDDKDRPYESDIRSNDRAIILKMRRRVNSLIRAFQENRRF